MASSGRDGATTSSSSSYHAFNSVDEIVSKPVLGSDGAAAWQDFRTKNKTTLAIAKKGSTAPSAPLKKSDRAATGFASWKEERANESTIRKETGRADLDSGYTVFERKGVEDGGISGKERKRIENRIRPDDAEYFLGPKESFEGWKFDYVFTTRDRGTGYYWDGTDSLKKLKGELNDDHNTESGADKKKENKNRTPDEEPSASKEEENSSGQPKKKKRKRSKKETGGGPVIVDDPNNPLEQVAAAMRRRQQQQPAGQQQQEVLLAQGWEAAVDSGTGKTYYYNRSTGERQWEKPKTATALPHGWTVAKDEASGMEYYYHSETGKTQWERPTTT